MNSKNWCMCTNVHITTIKMLFFDKNELYLDLNIFDKLVELKGYNYRDNRD